MRCYRQLLNLSCKDRINNEGVRRKIQAAIGEYGEDLTMIKKRNLRWFRHVSRFSALTKTNLEGTVNVKEEVDRRRGGKTILKSGQRWNLSVQSEHLKTEQDGKGFCEVICLALTTLQCYGIYLTTYIRLTN